MTITPVSSDFGPDARDPILTARAWLDQYEAIALATVIETWGSSPVPVGGQLVIAPDERFEGSISGGCVEAAVITEAATVMVNGGPKCLEFGVAHETAWQVGLPCGGRIEVYVERLGGRDGKLYADAILEARSSRTLLVARTSLANGVRALHRDLEPFPDDAAYLAAGESRVVDTRDGRVFLQAFAPALHLIIVGAGHIGQVLADLARRIGYRVTVVDPRTAFSTSARFDRVALKQEWPETALPALHLDSRTAVVTLAHTANLDDEALTVALQSSCFYIGALGSRRTHEKRVERLRGAGVADEALACIDAPAGLSIGAKGAAEIAVSILAGVIEAQRRRVPQ
ncbi:MAG: XdhC family protein [Hyphomicrobium sp.]